MEVIGSGGKAFEEKPVQQSQARAYRPVPSPLSPIRAVVPLLLGAACLFTSLVGTVPAPVSASGLVGGAQPLASPVTPSGTDDTGPGQPLVYGRLLNSGDAASTDASNPASPSASSSANAEAKTKAPAARAGAVRTAGSGGSSSSTNPTAQNGSEVEEATRRMRATRTLKALGPDMFGDTTNFYDGSVNFANTDISLPGNSALPVEVARTYSAHQTETYGPSMMGDWNLELPYVYGIYVTGHAWEVSGSNPAQRCSSGNGPKSMGNEVGILYNRGNRLHLPGVGDVGLGSALSSYANFKATDGQTTYKVNPNYTQVRCNVARLANDGAVGTYTYGYPLNSTYTGEGFTVLGTDGTTYRFDWMTSRMVNPLITIYTANQMRTTQRIEVRIYPTLVTDRFGNTVTYNWQGELLQSIVASDGRKLIFHYNADGSAPLQSVTATNSNALSTPRTWTYAYTTHGTDTAANHNTLVNEFTLNTVTLPDQTTWQYTFPNFAPTYVNPANGGCTVPADWQPSVQNQTATLKHPSGATGTFVFLLTRHGRTQVDNSCQGDDTVNDFFEPPVLTDSFALSTKSISGPGLPSQTWSMAYDAPRGSTLQDNDTSQDAVTHVVLTNPDSTSVRYTFGIQFEHNEGKLQTIETRDAGGNTVKTVQNTYLLDYGAASPPPPYVYQVGGGGYDNYAQNYQTPRTKTVVTQDGTTYTNTVNAFDAMAREVTATRASASAGYGYSRTDTKAFYDDTTHWVLGQVQSLTNTDTNRVQSSATYDPGTARPLTTSQYGLLVKTMTYNADGTLKTIADGLNRTTTLAGWKAGVPQSVTFADNSTQSATVDDFGEVVSQTDELGSTTSYTYNAVGWLTGITYPTPVAADGVSQWDPVGIAYSTLASGDGVGQAGEWKVVETHGRLQKTAYLDAHMNAVIGVETDTATGETRYANTTYDYLGRATFTAYPSGSAGATIGVTTTYDPLGRAVKTQTNDNGTVTLSQTAYLAGNQVQVTDAMGHVTTTQSQAFDTPAYDAPTLVTAPLGQSTSYSRDLFGHVLQAVRTDLNTGTSVTETQSYDDYYRPCRVSRPESGQSLIYYDAASQATWTAEGVSGAGTTSTVGTSQCGYAAATAAQKITNGYTLRGWKNSIGYGDGTSGVTITYAADGKPLTVANAVSTWTYTYDTLRLMSQQTVNMYGSIILPHTLAYDTMGHLASETYQEGSQVSYAPDAWGAQRQLVSSRAAGNAAWVTQTARWANGALKSATLGNGMTLGTALDGRQRITQQLVGTGTAGSGGQVQNLTYGYDNDNQLLTVTDGATASPSGTDTASYGYDALHRLTSATSSGMWGTYGYQYDGIGNITGRTGSVANTGLSYTYDHTANRLTAVTGASLRAYSYDPAGRVAGDGRYNYSWNLAGQLTKVTSATTGAVVAYYTYDGNGHRVRADYADGSFEYAFYDPAGRLLYTNKSSAGRAVIYVDFDGRTMVEHSENGQVWSFVDTYLHPDWQGSARVATTPGGAVSWREHYDPYGKRLTNAGVEKRGYTGHSYDAETGNTYMLARYYDGEVGRFLRPDPVGSADDFVLYAYVHGNPTNATDPTGMVHEYAQPRGLGGGFGMGLEGSDLINAGDGASNAPETDPTGNAQQDTGTTNTEPTTVASAAGKAQTDAAQVPTQIGENYIPSGTTETVKTVAGIIANETTSMRDGATEHIGDARNLLAHQRINAERYYGSRVNSLAGEMSPVFTGAAFQSSLAATIKAVGEDLRGIDPTGGATNYNMRTAGQNTAQGNNPPHFLQGYTVNTRSGPFPSWSVSQYIMTYGPPR